MPIELVFARQERPAGLSTLEQVRALRDEAAEQAAEARAQVGSTPEHFGAAGDGLTDDTDALIAWMENGGKMTANGTYLVQGRGPDTGGAYARLLRDVDFQAGPDCRFVAGLGLDNDVLRYTAQLSVYNAGKRPKITWRGGTFDQTLQANSTIIPNSDSYPPIRQGVSVTTDGFYIIGWVNAGTSHHIGVDKVTVENVKFYSGAHWQIAGGDSQLFVGGVRHVVVNNCEFTGGRDCGFYGSWLPDEISENLSDGSFTVTNNTFTACNWGAAVKRRPHNLVMTGNRGYNTPQLLVFQSLALGADGAGAVIANNIAERAWQVVRVDDVIGAEVYGNVSINHGPLLADGSTPTVVYGAYNCVVRLQGCMSCRVHDNTLVSINPTGAASAATVVYSNAGLFNPATTHCDIYHNRAFAGTSVADERENEADWNRYWRNVGSDAMSSLVILRGQNSTDSDALTFWSSGTTTITGNTDQASLRSATVRPKRIRRSGDRVTFSAGGNLTGTGGGKRLYVAIAGIQSLLGTLTGEGEWWLEGTATFTGGSLRTHLRVTTSTGQTFARASTSGLAAESAWDIDILGQLVAAADTITCTSMRID